jgi:DUF438 domain-containing protein
MNTPINLNTGGLTPEQIDLVFFHLPMEVTFVNEHDMVVYYSEGKTRIFSREPGIIGKSVQNCHSPSSVPLINRILDAFRAGTKDSVDYWRTHEGKFVHIRYLAVRDKAGKYRGCLETVQDVTGIRKLEGEGNDLDG